MKGPDNHKFYFFEKTYHIDIEDLIHVYIYKLLYKLLIFTPFNRLGFKDYLAMSYLCLLVHVVSFNRSNVYYRALFKVWYSIIIIANTIQMLTKQPAPPPPHLP